MFIDFCEFDVLLEQDFGVIRGGKKGNWIYQMIDVCKKVQVQVLEFIDFGLEFQIVKVLIDECLIEWVVDSCLEIWVIVIWVFNMDKEGQINCLEIFMFMWLEIEDVCWIWVMDVLCDVMCIIGLKIYLCFYEWDLLDGVWQVISIDLVWVS